MIDVDPFPAGYPRVTPYLHVDGAAAALDLYRDLFGATERMRMSAPGGKIGHAELQIGDSIIMVADEYPDMGIKGPKAIGGTPVTVHLYVEDVDAVWERALAAGATPQQPPEDQFYGDRACRFEDPFGHSWSVATHVEDVPPDEMERRMAQMMES